MPSMQNAAPGTKSMKFQDGLNPFAPFLSRPVSFVRLICTFAATVYIHNMLTQFFFAFFLDRVKKWEKLKKPWLQILIIDFE